jgi:hypothetical protein
MNQLLDDRLTSLVHAEFCEMPGLRLTRQQVQRLWSLDPATCLQLLATLVESGFLTIMPDGRYARVGDSEIAARLSNVRPALRTNLQRAS